MPLIGDDDQFESEYMAALKVLLTRHGNPLTYEKDRNALDAGLHLWATSQAGRAASQVRVWFQAKGKRASTLTLAAFRSSEDVQVRVTVDHLRFWYASPEPVYLVVYIESANEFIAEDVRDIVERQWPTGNFYAAVESQKEVTVRVKSAVLDDERLDGMLVHRSMRIDGPSFRGRPLGHGFDPLRSQIEACEPDLFLRIVERLLQVHDFREREREAMGTHLEVREGRLYETLEWQSPAFAEYGVGPRDDFRGEPSVESIHGPALIVLDSEPNRVRLSESERAGVERAVSGEPAAVAVIYNGRELSSSGGLWRGTMRDLGVASSVDILGLESVTSLLLVATLVYLEFAPQIRWRHVNYRW